MLTRQFDTTGQTTAQPVVAQRTPLSEATRSELASNGSLPDVDLVTGMLPPHARAGATRRSSGGRWDRAGRVLLQLQRRRGNRYVQQVLGHTRQAANSATAPVIQTALVLGPANDRYEREADQLAQQVVGGAARLGSRAHHHEDGGEEVRDVPQIQRLHRGEDGVADSEVQQSIGQARGGGRPLESGVRHWMEQRFDADFSGVRVHTDTRADQLNRLLAARAFTTGQDIFLRRGEPGPGSRAGRALIAHELTHVLQQRGNKQGRKVLGARPTHGPTILPSGSLVVQRLISANKFEADTAFSWFSGKSDQTFRDIVAGLRAYEAGTDPTALQRTYDTATRWLYSIPAKGSSRVAHVERLVEELQCTPELQRTSNAQARERITTSSLPKAYKDRACRLIAAPDEINQTAFGVCGLVSILRPVLTYDPLKFANLATRALNDPNLERNKWKEVFARRANNEQKELGAEFDYLVAQWLVRHAKSVTGNVSQIILEWQAGTVTEAVKTKKYGDVFAAQKTFSGTFKISDWEDVLGHFATTTGGLNYLLSSVVGASASYKIKITDFDADYKLAKTKVGAHGAVIASVTNTAFYQQGGAAIDNPPTRPKPGAASPKFVHWVIIDNVQPEGDYFKITIWTWAKFFTARVHKNVAEQYFYSFVAAKLA